MDPFRNELLAAHEKIARLENELVDARAAAEVRTQHAPRSALRGASPLIILGVTGAFFLLGILGAVVLLSGRAAALPTEATPEYRGIATANPSPKNPPQTVAPAVAPQTTASAKGCVCQPGDPLCSCL